MGGGMKGIPEGASVVIPRLCCRDVAAAIDFCANTFRAVELNRRAGPDGRAAHALMTIGPAMIMIEAEWPGLASRAPLADGSSPVVIYVYVEDVDDTVERAVAVGGNVLIPATNQFWGDRNCMGHGSGGACVDYRRARGGHVGKPASGAMVEYPEHPRCRSLAGCLIRLHGFAAGGCAARA